MSTDINIEIKEVNAFNISIPPYWVTVAAGGDYILESEGDVTFEYKDWKIFASAEKDCWDDISIITVYQAYHKNFGLPNLVWGTYDESSGGLWSNNKALLELFTKDFPPYHFD